jgi:hypothetical protein
LNIGIEMEKVGNGNGKSIFKFSRKFSSNWDELDGRKYVS